MKTKHNTKPPNIKLKPKSPPPLPQVTKTNLTVDVSIDKLVEKIYRDKLRLSNHCYLNGIKVASFILYSEAVRYCEEFNRYKTANSEKMTTISD